MKTIILNEPGSFSLIETAPPPAPGPGEAQVAIRRVGICGTDLHAYRGRQPFFAYPRILGHELGAEIVALGPSESDHGLKVGDRVCIRPYLNCGKCGACKRGTTNCCSKLQVLGVHTDGGMRERINIPMDKLHQANALSFDQLAIVEMLCIGAHASRRAEVVPGEFALVIGAGPIGLGTTQFAALDGARVIAMDVADSRLAQASEQPGIEFVVDGRGDVAGPTPRHHRRGRPAHPGFRRHGQPEIHDEQLWHGGPGRAAGLCQPGAGGDQLQRSRISPAGNHTEKQPQRHRPGL
jgi:threonine dehydrogenase-like Zn-dependent dehydrogenase